MNPTPIDRKALVTRHNIRPADITRVIPLGNGETCFGCDCTGLQTFGGNTLAHWAWHSFPVPEGLDLSTWPETGSFMTGRLTGTGQDIFPKDRWNGVEYTFDNPHSVNLGRLSFVHRDGSPLTEEEIENSSRECHLWTGRLDTSFTFAGSTVSVTGCAHPEHHALAVKIAGGENLAIALDFPYANIEQKMTMGDFSTPDRHETVFTPAENRCSILRHMDDLHYWADLSWTNADLEIAGPHSLILRPTGETELTLRYAGEQITAPNPTFAETLAQQGYNGHTEIAGFEEGANDSRLMLLGFAEEEPVVFYDCTIKKPLAGRFYRAAQEAQAENKAFSTLDFYPVAMTAIGKMDQKIIALSADETVSQMLRIPVGTAVLVLETVIYNSRLEAVEHKRGYYRTDKYSFKLHRSI